MKNHYQIIPVNTLHQVEKLRNLSIQTFRESYEHMNDPEDFQKYLDQAFAFSQLEKEVTHPESYFYFLEYNNVIAGYLKLNIGSVQTDRRFPEAMEVERIYLLKDFQKRGLGRIMIQFAMERAKEWNKPYLWLGVWKKNPNAIAFYKSMGFVFFGTHTFTIGKDAQEDELYKLSV